MREGDCTPPNNWGQSTIHQALSRVSGALESEGFPLTVFPMPKAPTTTPASYEAAMDELEQLVAQIESGQLPLEQLLTGYQRGAELLQFCRDKLQAVEQQIKVLDEGALKPWTQQ